MRLGWAAVWAGLCVLGCTSNTEDVLSVASGSARVEVRDQGQELVLLKGEARLLSLPRDAFVLGVVREIDDSRGYDPFWLVHPEPLLRAEPPEGLRWLVPESSAARLDGSELVVELTYKQQMTAEVRLVVEARGRWRMDFNAAGPLPVAYHRLALRVDPTEEMYGLGEWFDQPFHRGKLRPMQLEPDLRVDGATNEAHVPIPLLLGPSGWGLFVASERYGVFDVGSSEPERVVVTYGSAGAETSLQAHLFVEEDPLDLTRHYHEVTGRPALPAEWAYGPWIWRDENRDQAEVEDDIRRIRELDLATSALWIDRPYASAVNTFDFLPADYPDPAAMVTAAHAAGLRLALWHTPYLEDATGPLRATAMMSGFFPPQVGLRANPWSELIDLSKDEARAWWQGNLQAYANLGFEGYKLDYAEDIVPGPGDGRFGWRFEGGEDGLVMHHRYPGLYHQTYAEMLPESGGFLLCRAARWGGQRWASVIWPGDLDASFAEHRAPIEGEGALHVGGLPAAVSAAVGLGPSGFPLFGSDTGGYRRSPPDEETFIRWVEHTTFSAVMQVGDSSSQPPWVYTPENGRSDTTLDLYRRYARLHLRLFPYTWSFVRRNQTDGRAILRPLGLAYPELGVHPRHDYMLGDAILVAPVTTRGARTRTVHLPAGRWLDGWTGAWVDGGTGPQEVSAPLERIPHYYREGAIIPLLRPDADTLSPATDPDVVSVADAPGALWVRVAGRPVSAARFEIFDGTTIESSRTDEGFELRLTEGQRFDAGVVFEVWGEAEPSQITELDGAVLERRASLEALETARSGYASADGRTWIKPLGGSGARWRD